MSWITYHRNRLQPLQAQEGVAAAAGAAGDTLREFTQGLESIRRQVQADIVEIRNLHEGIAGLRQADALMLQRVQTLETQMDNIPARVYNLEKYGNDVTIKLPDDINALDSRLKDLEAQPMEAAARLKKRQDWMMVYTAVGGCLFMVVSLLISLLGMIFTYLLAKGII